jgi:hypothetical protein
MTYRVENGKWTPTELEGTDDCSSWEEWLRRRGYRSYPEFTMGREGGLQALVHSAGEDGEDDRADNPREDFLVQFSMLTTGRVVICATLPDLLAVLERAAPACHAVAEGMDAEERDAHDEHVFEGQDAIECRLCRWGRGEARR